jgi:hypothetical protein
VRGEVNQSSGIVSPERGKAVDVMKINKRMKAVKGRCLKGFEYLFMICFRNVKKNDHDHDHDHEYGYEYE